MIFRVIKTIFPTADGVKYFSIMFPGFPANDECQFSHIKPVTTIEKAESHFHDISVPGSKALNFTIVWKHKHKRVRWLKTTMRSCIHQPQDLGHACEDQRDKGLFRCSDCDMQEQLLLPKDRLFILIRTELNVHYLFLPS